MLDPFKPFRGTEFSHIWRQLLHSEQLVLLGLALGVGGAAAFGAILFREFLGFVQEIGFNSSEEGIHPFVEVLPTWQIILIPTLGGVIVGLFCKFFLGGRPRNVADVIEAEAYRDGAMSFRDGFKAALVSAFSLGTGTSLGREGPVVHLGASLGASLARQLRLRKGAARTLLGCGVASAVACSFNAPIAGALFAHEVVLGHYAVSAFAPIVLASVTGTVISRAYFGDNPAFLVPGYEIQSFWEFPAFIMLGFLGAVVAVMVMRSVPIVVQAANRLRIPHWVRPGCAGLIIGVLAASGYPELIGVGYGAMDTALHELYDWGFLMQLLILKCFVVVVCLGLGSAGGVFSPSLFIGAMLGGAFGIVATGMFPHLSSGHGAYTLVGMGTVASAVLGAPISTTLMIFELTGDYAVTTAVMVSSVIASVVLDQGQGSFFDRQLASRGFSAKWGREIEPLRRIKVRQVMKMQFRTVQTGEGLCTVRDKLIDAPHGELFVVDKIGRLSGTIMLADLSKAAFDPDIGDEVVASDVARAEPPTLCVNDSLERAIKLMETSGEEHLPVIDDIHTRIVVGFVHEKDAIMAYNDALMEHQAELHGTDTPPKIF